MASVLGDIQNLSGGGPGQPALADLVSSRWVGVENPQRLLQPQHFCALYFCDVISG